MSDQPNLFELMKPAVRMDLRNHYRRHDEFDKYCLPDNVLCQMMDDFERKHRIDHEELTPTQAKRRCFSSSSSRNNSGNSKDNKYRNSDYDEFEKACLPDAVLCQMMDRFEEEHPEYAVPDVTMKISVNDSPIHPPRPHYKNSLITPPSTSSPSTPQKEEKEILTKEVRPRGEETDQAFSVNDVTSLKDREILTSGVTSQEGRTMLTDIKSQEDEGEMSTNSSSSTNRLASQQDSKLLKNGATSLDDGEVLNEDRKGGIPQNDVLKRASDMSNENPPSISTMSQLVEETYHHQRDVDQIDQEKKKLITQMLNVRRNLELYVNSHLPISIQRKKMSLKKNIEYLGKHHRACFYKMSFIQNMHQIREYGNDAAHGGILPTRSILEDTIKKFVDLQKTVIHDHCQHHQHY